MHNNFLPQIDVAKCTGCELCVRVCPSGALAMTSGSSRTIAFIAQPDACEYAGQCENVCPTQAISLIFEIVPMNEAKDGKSMKL